MSFLVEYFPNQKLFIRQINQTTIGGSMPEWLIDIGKTGTVLSAENDGYGILIGFGSIKFRYPYTALNLVR